MSRRWPSFAALLGALAIISGCGSARDAVGCDVDLASLNSAIAGFQSGTILSSPEQEALDVQINQVETTCDISKMEVAGALISAFKLRGAKEKIAELYEKVKPEGDTEKEILYFRATEFFVDVRNREKAHAYLVKLEGVSRDADMADTARIEFECVFGRCGRAVEKAKRLSAKYPEIVGYHVFLGLSHADRHEFTEAAEQFDEILNSNAVGTINSETALIAVASYSNSGQKEKATRFYDLYSQSTQVQVGVNDLNFANMKKVLEDKSGQTFLFSDWPPNN